VMSNRASIRVSRKLRDEIGVVCDARAFAWMLKSLCHPKEETHGERFRKRGNQNEPNIPTRANICPTKLEFPVKRR